MRPKYCAPHLLHEHIQNIGLLHYKIDDVNTLVVTSSAITFACIFWIYFKIKSALFLVVGDLHVNNEMHMVTSFGDAHRSSDAYKYPLRWVCVHVCKYLLNILWFEKNQDHNNLYNMNNGLKPSHRIMLCHPQSFGRWIGCADGLDRPFLIWSNYRECDRTCGAYDSTLKCLQTKC